MTFYVFLSTLSSSYRLAFVVNEQIEIFVTSENPERIEKTPHFFAQVSHVNFAYDTPKTKGSHTQSRKQ